MPNDGSNSYQYGDAAGNIGGLPAGTLIGFENDTDGSFIAGEDLRYGDPAFARPGNLTQVFAPHRNKEVIDLSADLVASNSIAVTVNGNAVTAVVYATSHDATMAAIVNAINANAALIALGVTAVKTGARQITISAGSVELTGTLVVTLGAGQAVAAYTYSCGDKFMGFVIRATISYSLSADGVPSGKALSIMKWGRMIVRVITGETLLANKPVFLDDDPANTTTYKSVSGVALNNLDIGAWFTGNPANGLVEVDVRGIK